MTDAEIAELIARHEELAGFASMADLHRRTAAAIRFLLAERQWQPIETAPRDGTPILWHSGTEYAVIFWPVYAACFELGIWQHVPATPIAQVVQPKLNT